MLNIDAFLKRLEQLMENHQLNAAAFAEKIGVQRSSVSHILSRRNKPSLEFILKVQAEFTEADFDWLLLGARKKSSPTSNQLLVDQGKVDELEADKSINPPKSLFQLLWTYLTPKFYRSFRLIRMVLFAYFCLNLSIFAPYETTTCVHFSDAYLLLYR
jgi:transcriptional regulator with XRE-family HTH domain